MGFEKQGDEILFKDSEDCPIRDVIGRLGDRWSILVLTALSAGPVRFGHLKKNIENISPRMLTQVLRTLEREGYVVRTVYAEAPARVEYELSELGKKLFQKIMGLIVWARDNHDDVRQARTQFDEIEESKPV